MRHMIKSDIGLIFDALLQNDGSSPKQTLNFEVRSDKCCILIGDSYECDTQNIYGVKIPFLEPNKEIITTLIWPTLIPYNRIGNCTLRIISRRPSGRQIDDIKLIHFNTTIDTNNLHNNMIVYFNEMKKMHGYTKCEFEDLNPFDKCKPVNCELKYFGRRNFFKYPDCVPAAICENNPDVVYDYVSNTCRNLKNVLSSEDIEQMKNGNFTNWIERYDDNQETTSMTSEQKTEILKRIRRSLNESQSFADMSLSSALFIIKMIILIIFVYAMMALFISIIFYTCISLGMISTSVTMNTFERIN